MPATKRLSGEGTVAERTTTGLPFSVLRAVLVISQQIYDQFVIPSLLQPSVDQYEAFLRSRWSSYLDIQRGYNAVLAGATSEDRVLAFAERSRRICLEQVREGARALAGEDAMAEIDFADHALRRALRQVLRLPSLPPPRDLEADARAAWNFEAYSALWSFEMASLLVATHKDMKLAPGIADAIFGHLRASALGAHRSANEAVLLRKTEPEVPELPMGSFDEEDQDLVRASELDTIASIESAAR